ncbi:4Fe-4S binding protein [Desulfosediminicola ganghwensis]|uniref:FMN-binding protein n=1 Tax=Desulfosediminicola ganghwensis TaxID=2569540 RepID=UPI0010ACA84D|nr:4Fe-4S binding protein [Desulfosediminicola ganghwensis]
MSRFSRLIASLLVPLALILAWAGGQYRATGVVLEQLSNIADDIIEVRPIGDNLYKAKSRTNQDTIFYVATACEPSYGGLMEVAAVIDNDKQIRHTAILSSSDTRSYLEKITGLGVLQGFIDKRIDHSPQVDAVSGATLSSAAVIRGIERAAQQIGSTEFGIRQVKKQAEPATPEKLKLAVICLFFVAAFIITTGKIKKKNRARAVLLSTSVVVLGFWLGAQYSLATVVSLLNGSWVKGMSSYAALLCLVLAILAFLVTRKNLFCTYICPFGAIQEGLGKITGCSAPVQQKWMVWAGRSWVLMVLMAALYYKSPSYAMYEPFGKVFNFIGSGIIYSITILVVLASLMFKRPWCHLFCPTSAIISYLRFARRAFAPQPASAKAQPVREIVK